MLRGPICRALGALAALCLPATLAAQERTSLAASALFYGDNTEFRGPFRDGETLFGVALRAFADVEMSEQVAFRLGAVGNHRFGGEDAFEFVRPLVALRVRSPRWTFAFGSLDTSESRPPAGPDRGGPHGLLPPLQRETLAFERPAEAGLQWTFRSPRVRHEVWINWQQVNTPNHRERFDAGTNFELDWSGLVGLGFQGHVVHSGGQLYAAGPVSDSVALGPGLTVRARPRPLEALSLEAFALVSHHVPDRANRDRSRRGAGLFLRAQAVRSGWRGHLIIWRGDDFIKAEGDQNYLSVTMDGRRWRGTRDYSELGLARGWALARGVALEVSARVHRIEPHNYAYSYRILALTDLRWHLR